MVDDRPAWARRMTSERQARGWSEAEAAAAMRAHAPGQLPSDASLLRQWKRWEAAETAPGADFYQPIIAATFGTVTHAMFPVPPQRDAGAGVLTMTGPDTLGLASRLQRSDLGPATLDGLRIMTDRLCSQYSSVPADQLLAGGRTWLRRMTAFRGQRVTLRQRQEILIQAGWAALLVGCAEHDMGSRQAAETTRQAALSLGTEAGQGDIMGWAHEMRAWINLTSGDYRSVIAAARAGMQAAPHSGVAVQLAAQEAKAWARIGDRRQTEAALDRGRRLLDSMPYPENLAHHFVVDPAKFDFYAMDCYRMLGDDKMAANLASEVIQAGTGFDGTERAPMRLAEARVTLGVVAARQGDVHEAVSQGERALSGQRKSLPSLLMVARDLSRVLSELYPKEPGTRHFLDHLRTLGPARGVR